MDDKKKGKWAKVADEIRGTMSKESSAYLLECSREIRDGFELRELPDRKNDMKIIIDNPIIQDYIKEQAKLNNQSFSEYITDLVKFEKAENEFILSEVSEDIKALEDGTLDPNTLGSFDDLLTYLEKTDPENIIAEYANEHNLELYEALHDIVNEHKEMKLLLLYDNGKLSIGQVAEELAISKSEVMDLLKKYGIPFVRVDEEYLKQEFEAFEKTDKSNKKGKWAEFAERMDGIFTSDIVEHIEKSRKELRDED